MSGRCVWEGCEIQGGPGLTRVSTKLLWANLFSHAQSNNEPLPERLPGVCHLHNDWRSGFEHMVSFKDCG